MAGLVDCAGEFADDARGLRYMEDIVGGLPSVNSEHNPYFVRPTWNTD